FVGRTLIGREAVFVGLYRHEQFAARGFELLVFGLGPLLGLLQLGCLSVEEFLCRALIGREALLVDLHRRQQFAARGFELVVFGLGPGLRTLKLLAVLAEPGILQTDLILDLPDVLLAL